MEPRESLDSFKLSELDLEIVNALQISPRASWAAVGRALDVDASTAARRWARLQGHGAAWVSCQPLFVPDPAMALVEIVNEPGRSLEVAEALAGDPQAMTIDVSAGARDLLVTVVCDDSDQLSWYLLERLARVPYVLRVQSHILVRTYTDASRWRLRALSRGQERALLSGLPKPPKDGGAYLPTAADRELAAALSVDGRAPLSELARVGGTSESTTRRRLNHLIGSGNVRLRCELARALTGWSVSEWLFARVPSDRLDEAAATLSTVGEVRAILSAAGPFNLLIAVWLRTISDGQRLETSIMRKLPHIDVVDRSVVIRPYKLAGRRLDRRGFSTGTVPLDLQRRPEI
ncbi:Lrp/AsnC family transcriptional regulator [Streptomyces sp. B-S-A8]|uniref:Lrp/AsnC family transcriptional regulator n=1 Tax=Streptomyces solicavernae TaxID=3043614 RepID=A0ABT6RZA2_9ACTN|nr:Lrp/AsnC family transcriptional regulator [Streptomyces sp. B-S-A8]MDI3388991.1 Lrp/AsnC family transcriptional regulator [Streptomyces sp. B-S-A8]